MTHGPSGDAARLGPGNDPPAAGSSPTNGAAMHGPIRRPVTITNPRGLHPRIITRFVQKTRDFSSVIAVWNGDQRADGRSVMDLMLLVAFPGTELVLEVEGPDAAAAVGPLAAILADPGGEDYDSTDDMAGGI